MAEPFIGEIRLFGFNFAPVGWAMCNGQLLSISQNTALFSLLGTYYGGDGQTTFGLPDLRGRVPLNMGQAPGLSSYSIGESGGNETVTLSGSQLPSHTHALQGSDAQAATDRPDGAVLGRPTAGNIYASPPGNVALDQSAIAGSGGGQPVAIRAPYLALNFCIALQGIFPSRG